MHVGKTRNTYFSHVGKECVVEEFVVSSDIISKNGINNTH